MPKLPSSNKLSKTSKSRRLEGQHDRQSQSAQLGRNGGPCLTLSYTGDGDAIAARLAGSAEFAMHTRFAVDGQTAAPQGRPATVCWHTDRDGDYLELEYRFTGGLRVQRQFYLAHRDRVLLVADAVLDSSASGSYETTLAGDIQLDRTRTVFLGAGFRSFPLALSENRREASDSLLRGKEKGVRCNWSGARAYFPWLVDLDPRRRKQPPLWRKLTVGETRQIVPDHVAVGYRIQLGQTQWLVYRSLAAKANRSVLGHNLSSESLFGRFMKTGLVEPLLYID